MSTIAILADKDGNFIGQKERRQLQRGDMVAITSLWVENSRGQVLIAQRSWGKAHDPGLWGPAAAGTLEPGETFEDNVAKEAEEEIGLTGINPKEVYRTHYWRKKDGTGRYAVWYRVQVDYPLEYFKLQKDEVAAIKWISKDELLRQTREHPDQFVGWPERWELMMKVSGYKKQ